MFKHTEKQAKRQAAQAYSQRIERRLFASVEGLLGELNGRLDRRLVATFFRLLLALLIHRHRNEGLWLSELGSWLVPENAVAGAKRIAKLLHSDKWSSQLLVARFWQQSEARVAAGVTQGETMLALWDESVVEKPESLQLAGLGPVRSTKAARLKRIKPGYYNPPGGRPVFTPGFHWLQVLVCSLRGPVTLAHTRLWTNRGELASSRRDQEQTVLREAAERFGPRVLHVFDRGFAGAPWLALLMVHGCRFILRWPKDYHLLDAHGVEQKAWQIGRGKRSWQQRWLWDARRRCRRKVGVVAFPVTDRSFAQPLWLVVSRPGGGRPPWYLLTNEPAETAEQAWQIILAYGRRWQVELSLRFEKAELGAESLRVFSWEVRQRLFLMLAVVHAFCLQLLSPPLKALKDYLLQHWCHRTGKRSRATSAPLVRLRLALALLWLHFPPPFLARLN